MKSMSASLIIVAGVGCLIASALSRHGDTSVFIGGCGVLVTIAGFAGWVHALRTPAS